MAVNLSPIWGAGAQLFDNSGNVLSGGKIYTYAAGTTTPATTYTSSSGIAANSNPIILNSAGRVPYEIWLSDTLSYKFVLKDSNDTLIATYDNLVGINSNFIAYTAQQEIQTATAGQTVFNLTTMQYQPATNNLSVYVDGVNQYGPGAQYAFVETDSDTVTFVSGLHVGASVKFTTASPVSSSSTNAENVAYDPPFTGAVGTNVEAKLAQTVSVKDFGAVGDGVTDDTDAIQDAISYVAGLLGGTVYFPTGTYLTTSTLTVPAGTGVYVNIVGAAYERYSVNGGSRILADHSTGPVIRFYGSNQSLRSIGITASLSRTNGVAGSNYGVLVEAPDVSGQDGHIETFTMENVVIFNQPNSGFVSSGYQFRFYLNGCGAQDCKGHGFVFDGGEYTSRTNRGRVGGLVMIQPRTYNCNGHSLLLGFGGSAGTSFGAYRCTIIDSDFDAGVLDTGLVGYKGLYNIAIHGDSIYTQNLAMNGSQSGTPDVLTGMYLTGWDQQHSGNRYIDCNGVAFIKAPGGVNATDINFSNSYVTGTYNPAITYQDTGGFVVESVYWQGDTSGITQVFQAGIDRTYQLDSDALDISFRPFKGRQVVLTSTPDNAFSATRANAELFAEFIRTGTGAGIVKIGAIGGDARFESASNTDVTLVRNGTEKLRVKSNTIKLSGIPTSSSGLGSGELWNDSGTLKIIP